MNILLGFFKQTSWNDGQAGSHIVIVNDRLIDKSMIYWSVAAWSNHQRPGVNSKESSTDSAATEKIQRRRWSFEKTERQRWSWTSVHHLVDATQPDVLRLFNEYVEEDFSEFKKA